MDRTDNILLNQILKITGFVVLFFLVLFLLNKVFMFKEGTAVGDFYKEERDTYEVILIGSSRMLFGIDPRILKSEYDIDAYNFAQYGQHLPLNYYYVLDAIRTQHPKKVVLDVYRLDLELNEQTDDLVHMHESIDNMVWSKNKIKAIHDLNSISNSPQYYLPFIYYHSRWKELNKSDFVNGDETIFGYRELSSATPYDAFEIVPENEKLTPSDTVMEYLEKIRIVCEESGTELVLINLLRYSPLDDGNLAISDDMSEEEKVEINIKKSDCETNLRLQKMANGLADYAKEHNLLYINYNHIIDEIDFDFKNDMYDENHANINGALKQTEYLGRMIKQ